jgi:hypothetical protein
MAITQKRLCGPSMLTASTATYYTVPSSTTTIVKQILLTNTTSSAKTATVRLLPSGVNETATPNWVDILSSVTLAANETMAFNCSMVMNYTGGAGDEIKALASAAGAVNLTVFGIEEV